MGCSASKHQVKAAGPEEIKASAEQRAQPPPVLLGTEASARGKAAGPEEPLASIEQHAQPAPALLVTADAVTVVRSGCDEVRTSKCPLVPADDALARLKQGNARYVASSCRRGVQDSARRALADDGQLPMAAVLGCADSRCPPELLFDAGPGDIFVCRNAGNSVIHGEGSVVASLEYCAVHLHTKLLVVLGHTQCGAIKGAMASIPVRSRSNKIPAEGYSPTAADATPDQGAGALESYLTALAPVVQKAKKELPAGACEEEVAAHAIRVNVLGTVDRILQFSPPLREKVDAGELKVHGAIYDITTGQVEFLEEQVEKEADRFLRV